VRVIELTLPVPLKSDAPVFEAAWVKILEIRVLLASLGAAPSAPVGFQFSLWRDGLPVDAVPQNGWLEVESTDPAEW
jgi:hypothetical protein